MPEREINFVLVAVIGIVLGCIFGTGTVEASEKLQVIPAETAEMVRLREAVEHEIEGLRPRFCYFFILST